MASINGSLVCSAKATASFRSSCRPACPNQFRASPRPAIATANGEPTTRLPLVGSPFVQSIVACDHRITSSISPAANLIPIGPKRPGRSAMRRRLNRAAPATRTPAAAIPVPDRTAHATPRGSSSQLRVRSGRRQERSVREAPQSERQIHRHGLASRFRTEGFAVRCASPSCCGRPRAAHRRRGRRAPN